MCKSCKEVFSVLEMKDGECKSCQLGMRPKIMEDKEELLYEYRTENKKPIGFFLMLVATGLVYYFYLNKIVLGIIVGVFLLGFFSWIRSNNNFLKIYTNSLQIGKSIIHKEDILNIESSKNKSIVNLKNDVEIIVNLNRVMPYFRDDIIKLLSEFINNKNSKFSIETKIEKKHNIFFTFLMISLTVLFVYHAYVQYRIVTFYHNPYFSIIKYR